MTPTTSPAPVRGEQWALLALVALIGLNLWPFLTAPGPILTDIRADTGLSYAGVAMLRMPPNEPSLMRLDQRHPR